MVTLSMGIPGESVPVCTGGLDSENTLGPRDRQDVLWEKASSNPLGEANQRYCHSLNGLAVGVVEDAITPDVFSGWPHLKDNRFRAGRVAPRD